MKKVAVERAKRSPSRRTWLSISKGALSNNLFKKRVTYYDGKNAKIYVAGHRGMVGCAIVRELQRQGYNNIITRTHKELDLCRQEDVEKFFAEEKPEYVFLWQRPRSAASSWRIRRRWPISCGST